MGHPLSRSGENARFLTALGMTELLLAGYWLLAELDSWLLSHAWGGFSYVS